MQQTLSHSLINLRQTERFLAGDSSPVEHHFLEGTYWLIMSHIEFNNSSYVTIAGNLHNETTDESYSPACFNHDTTATRAARVVVYCVIILISTLGNSMTIMVVWRNKTMRRTFHCFIVNLATTDMTITLVYMPRVIVIWLRGTDWIVEGIFGSVLCKIVPYLHGVSILVSILTLLTLAIDRFFAIVFPLKLELLTVKSSKLVTAFIWVLALSVRLPYFLSLKVIFHKSRSEFSCDANMKRTFKNSDAREIYYTFLLIAFYALPFVLIIASYTVIVFTLRRYKTPSDKEIAKLVQRRRGKASKKVIYMLLTVTAAFVFCWLTYFTGQIVFDPLPCDLRFWRLFLAHSNSALNPCLYPVFNEKFRKGYKRLLRSCCRWRHSLRR